MIDCPVWALWKKWLVISSERHIRAKMDGSVSFDFSLFLIFFQSKVQFATFLYLFVIFPFFPSLHQKIVSILVRIIPHVYIVKNKRFNPVQCIFVFYLH